MPRRRARRLDAPRPRAEGSCPRPDPAARGNRSCPPHIEPLAAAVTRDVRGSLSSGEQQHRRRLVQMPDVTLAVRGEGYGGDAREQLRVRPPLLVAIQLLRAVDTLELEDCLAAAHGLNLGRQIATGLEHDILRLEK